MTSLFKTAFGTNVKNFNGDISRWNVGNVTGMLNIFEDCSSLKCDISNWDMHNVRGWSSGSYAGCSNSFKAICKSFECEKRMPNWILLPIKKKSKI